MTELARNPVAHLTEYELRHLTEHLEDSGRAEDLHHLLALETSEQRNAWYVAKESCADTAGYLVDVTRAWQLVEEAYVPTDSERAGQSIGLQCRCALVVASLNTMARNIPPALLTSLVEDKIWPPSQALAYARQVQEPGQQAQALVVLAPHLPEALLEEALATARGIQDEGRRTQVLVGLVPRIAELGYPEKALAAARGIEGEERRAEALVGLASHLSEASREQVLREAVAAARGIEDEKRRVEVLVRLAPHLFEGLREQALEEALAAARGIEGEERRAEALVGLAPHLSEASREQALQEALAATRGIEYGLFQAKVLARLAPHLSELLLRDALALALSLGHSSHEHWSCGEALAGLLPRLAELGCPEGALAAAQEMVDKLWQARALAGLAPHLTEPLLKKALTVARGMPDERWRIRALIGMAPHLPEALKEQTFKDALAAAREVRGLSAERATALAVLIPHLPEALLGDALAAVKGIADGFWRAEMLAGLASHLPEIERVQTLQEALAAAQRQMEAEAMTREIDGELPYAKSRPYSGSRLAGVLRILSFRMPEVLMAEALAAAQGITHEEKRAEVLAVLLPRLAELGHPEDALTAARRIADEWEQTEALAGLSSYLPETRRVRDLQDVIATAQAIADERGRAVALTRWALHSSEPLLREALATARGITDERWRTKALAGLLPRLAELGHPEDALAAAQEIVDASWRAEVLGRLAPHLPEIERVQALREALATALEIGGEDRRAEALARLAPHLPEPLLREAMATAREMGEWSRAPGPSKWRIEGKTLAGLLPRLAELGYPEEALRTTIPDDGWKAETLARLAPHLPEPLLREALARVRSLPPYQYQSQAKALARLLPRLAELGYPEEALAGLLPRLTDLIDKYDDHPTNERRRAEALARLAPHLPEPLLREALATAHAETLAILLPRLAELGYPEETLRAARGIEHDYWQADALARLAPHLPEPLLRCALATARALPRRDGWGRSIRAEALVALAARLAAVPRRDLARLWLHEQDGFNLLHFLARRTRQDLLGDLCALGPVIATLGGEEAIVETFHAIQDVGRWWP